MAVIVYFIALVILATGVVHQHYVVGQQLFVSIFLKERHGSVMLCLHRITLGIVADIVELRGRYTEVQHQHAVDGSEHRSFLLLQSFGLGTGGSHVTQLQTILFQLQRDEVGHAGGIFTAVCFGHGIFGNKAVFGNNVGHTSKGTPIAQRMLEEPFYGLISQGTLGGVDDALQEEVCLLQLVPEEGIDFGELERLETVFGKGLGTHHIQPRKQPATARRLLVGDAFGFYLDGEVGIHALHILLVECQFTDVIIAYGIAERLVGSRALITLLDLSKHFGADTPFSLLCLHREQCGTQNNYR